MNVVIEPQADTEIRAFAKTDAPAVANLFQTEMLGRPLPAPPTLTDYFIGHFLDGPLTDPDIPPLVCCSPDGTIEGFAGIVTQPMTFEGRSLRAAIVGTLMVRDHGRAPMTGARLLRRIIAGPQDLTLSETAGDASLAMWRQMGGAVLDRHSLQYIRVLRPAEFALDMLGNRLRAARVLMPIAGAIDKLLGKKDGPIRWTGLPSSFRPQGGVMARPTTAQAFAAFAQQVLSSRSVDLAWSHETLMHIVAQAMDKPNWGQAHLCEVVTRSGKQIGCFLIHFGKKGPARVVDLFHAPHQEGVVLDALFAHAQELGAASVQGRTTPQTLNALLGRRVIFAHESASVIDTHDPRLLDAFASGQAHFNGLVGERWTRLLGGRFEADFH